MKKQITSILLSGFFLLWGVIARAETTITYLHTDLSGSVIAKSDASGNVIWRKSYAPYGVTTEKDEDNRRGFAGHEEDPDGLVYMGNRYYDPEMGRFTSPDAMGFDPANPMSFNRYSYANDNPYRFVDPDGNSPLEWAFIVGDAASAVGNVASGNYGGAAWDVANIALDVAGPPGASEVSHAVKVEKALDNAEDAVKASKYIPGGKFSKGTKQETAKRADYKCEYCGTSTTPAMKSEKGVTPPKNEAQTDHIDPRSLGGTNAPSNAAHSCRTCNQGFSNSQKPSPRENK